MSALVGSEGTAAPDEAAKPRVAVFKMASCDGCQLQLLDAEEALLELAGAVEIANFAEASSGLHPGPYDVTLVEESRPRPSSWSSCARSAPSRGSSSRSEPARPPAASKRSATVGIWTSTSARCTRIRRSSTRWPSRRRSRITSRWISN